MQTLETERVPARDLIGVFLLNRPLDGVAVRMRIVLLLDEGASYNDIKEKLDTTAPTISLWKRRYREEGLVGLATFHPGQPPQKLTPQLRARILAKTQARRCRTAGTAAAQCH